MALSTADKAIAEAAYARTQKPSFLPGVYFGVILTIIGPPLMKAYHHPETSHREVIVYAVFLGFGLGCALASYFIARQRKRDFELVRFFEKHFPEACSWKQEEKILAQAEDLRLKAKVDRLIHSQS